MPCPAVRCGIVRCCAVLRAVLYFLFRTCQVSFDQVSYSSTEVHNTRFVRTTLLNHMHSQLSSAQLMLSSAQRSAVRCRALPCGAVPCCPVLSFEHAVLGIMRSYCCSHNNSHNQVRGHRTGYNHSGAEEYPRENTHTTQKWYMHIS